jgi:hypothetical protein
MILQNGFVPSQNLTPVRKPIFFYLIGFFIFLLVVFISWGGYQIYLQSNYIPGPPPPTPFFESPAKPYVSTDVEGVYACSVDGYCVVYPPQDAKKFCPKTFQTEGCDNQFGKKKNRCSR